MDFQIKSLPAETFAPLFALTDAELTRHQAHRKIVTAKPDVPCRVSLKDADIGDTVILVNYTHLPEDSPYRSSHAVYVRENARQAHPAVNEVPALIQSRLVSLRFFDKDHMMIHADVVEGTQAAKVISETFENTAIAYAHVHIAKPGCFVASVHRVPAL